MERDSRHSTRMNLRLVVHIVEALRTGVEEDLIIGELCVAYGINRETLGRIFGSVKRELDRFDSNRESAEPFSFDVLIEDCGEVISPNTPSIN